MFMIYTTNMLMSLAQRKRLVITSTPCVLSNEKLGDSGDVSMTTSYKKKLMVFSFPTEPDIKEQWIKATGRKDWEPTRTSTICSKHFAASDYLPMVKRRVLLLQAVPTLEVNHCVSVIVPQPYQESEEQTTDPVAGPSCSHHEGTQVPAEAMDDASEDQTNVQSEASPEPPPAPPSPAPAPPVPAKKPRHTSKVLWSNLHGPKRPRPPAAETAASEKLLAAATTPREPRRTCCVFGCRTNDLEHPGKTFFPFPETPQLIAQWLDLINRKDLARKALGVRESQVCSDHFDECEYVLGPLNFGAIPHYNLPRKRVDVVYATYTAPLDEVETIPAVKVEPEDPNEMQIEIHFNPEEPPTFHEPPSQAPNVLYPSNSLVSRLNNALVPPRDMGRALHIEVSPMDVTETIEVQMPNIIKVETINDSSTSVDQKQKSKEDFFRKATICAIEQINLSPTPPPQPDTTSVHVQTTKKLIEIMNAPLVRKFKTEIAEANRKIKQLERFSDKSKMSKKAFMACCDKYLDEKIADIVKSHVSLMVKSVGNRYSRKFKAFAINLFLCSPQSYKFVEQFFCLPSVHTIQRFQMPIRTGINPCLIDALKVKVNEMTDKGKVCTVCFDYMEVNKNLYYDVTNDVLCGIQDIDQVLGPEPAEYAVLIMVRGVYSTWKQPVSFALVSHKVYNPSLKEWLYKIIGLLFDIGLNVKAFAADMTTEFLDFSEVSATEPYFDVCGRRIYYIFDVPSLFKHARDDLMEYNFHIGQKVVKWSHILKVYDFDRQQELCLMPKITKNHVEPDEETKNDAKLAIQLFSRTVAAAMKFHVIANMANKKSNDTIEFITTMNNLFDILNSPRVSRDNELKQRYKATALQVEFLTNTLEYLQTLQMRDKSGNLVDKKVSFVTGLVITMKSVMSLLEDLKKVYLNQISTRKLSKDCMDEYFVKVRNLVGNSCARPTPVMFHRCFRRLFLTSLVSDAKKGGTELDLKSTLSKISEYVKTDWLDEEPERDKRLRVGVSDYNQLWPKPSLRFLTGYLIWKTMEKHTCCKMVESLCIDCNLESNGELLMARFKAFNAANMKKKDLPAPPQFIVDFVEKLNAIYNDYYRSGDMQAYGFGWNVYSAMEEETFDLPCECFPLKFFKMFFIRLRIYHTVKEYNRNNRPSRKRR